MISEKLQNAINEQITAEMWSANLYFCLLYTSYTTSLFESGINKIAQKVGEEAVETVIEATNGTDERLIYEGADQMCIRDRVRCCGVQWKY